MELHILQAKSGKNILTLTNISPSSSILNVKKEIHKLKKSLYPARQCLQLEMKSKAIPDEETLSSLGFTHGTRQLYFKDFGPQMSWKMVFLMEYIGPLALYLVEYCRPAFLYGAGAAQQPKHLVVHIAAACWTIHYVKRILETLFVHRFSNATMPIRNLFKNCSYYWLFGLYIGYYVNHPLYTPPYFGNIQMYLGLAAFLQTELGTLSIHWALRNLRPAGTKERRIPMPTSNPFTRMFQVVSCPNYTYEILGWVSFTVMTQCIPVGLFTLAGFYQMTIWALAKHRRYKKDFPDYPRGRTAIIPFLF